MLSFLRILLVEDEGIIARDIRRMLIKMGHTVVGHAISGEEAIGQATELKPELVLMDIRLEGEMDGIEAASIIHGEQNIPVIFLTAHTDEATLERAKMTGPFGYVVKPVVERDLRIGIEMGLYQHKTERMLAEHDRWMSTIIACAGEGLIVTDGAGFIKTANPAGCEITGWPVTEVFNRLLEEVVTLCDKDGEQLHEGPLVEVLQSSVHREWSGQMFLRRRTGELIPVDYTASAVQDELGRLIGMVLVLRDISQRHQAEQERERLVKELQDALAKVKTLRGLLPICAYCKNVREDGGYWKSVEHYVEENSELHFTHGLCPKCLKVHFPDVADEVLANLPEAERQ